MNIIETQAGFEISFEFNYQKIKEVKGISGAWFNGGRKVWTVPKRSAGAVDQLRRKYNLVDETITGPEEEFDTIPPMPELDIELDLPRELFPFQKKGVAYCRQHKRVIIGDQPGLGKTTQLIAAVVSLQAFPCLIVCPASLRLNWQKEWMDVARRRAIVLEDRVKNTWLQYCNRGLCDVFIVSYQSLKKYFVQPGWSKPKDGQLRVNQIPFRDCIKVFKSVAVDESHKCKDGSTQQSKFVMGITKGKEYVYELTGTPLVNKPKDLVPQLVIVDRLRDVVSHLADPSGKDSTGYRRFMMRYCGGGSDATNLKELNYRLNKFCFYRREKTEVLKDLPAKIRQVVLCDITNRREYDKAQSDFVDYLKSVKGCSDSDIRRKLRGEVMVKIGVLKQIAARGKIEAVRDHIDDIVEGGKKVVVFCTLREIGDQLKQIYPGAVMIRGSMSDAQKDQSMRSFQNDPDVTVAICSIKAAGLGLTLTASSEVAFIEFPWTFADCEQCEDRTHRIGQQDSVRAAYFLGEDTIDRYCYNIIQQKKTLARTVTGAADDVAEEVIDELLNLFNQR